MTTGRKARVIGALTITALVLIVALQNSEPVNLSLLFWHFTMSKLGLIVSLFVLGGLTGAVLALFAGRPQSPKG